MKSKIHEIPEIRFRSLPSVGAYLLFCRGWLNNEKSYKIRGKIAKNRSTFRKNKPNFKNIKINVSFFETSKYEILPAWRGEKTNPIQTQFKPNCQKAKNEPKKCFNNELQKISPLTGQKNKPNSNPKQTQFAKKLK